LQPLEGSEVTLSNTTHTLKLYGKSVVGGRIAALIKMAFSAKSGVTVKISVRAEEAGLAAAVIASVA
jgi:coatomer subunit gamma